MNDRDSELLCWFNKGHTWTSRQISWLTGESENNVRRRLARWKKNGFVSSASLTEGVTGKMEKQFYVTSGNQKKLLATYPDLLAYPANKLKTAAVPHLRGINDIWAGLHSALSSQDYYSMDFYPHYDFDNAAEDTLLHICSDLGTKIMADALIHFKCSEGHSLAYLEYDTGTESLKSKVTRHQSLFGKIETYAEFLDAGGFRKTSDLLGVDFSGFRLLLVTTSWKRIHHIRKQAESLGDLSFLWMTTFDDIIPENILGEVWLVGEEKRRLLKKYGANHGN